jgi:hypothetical protein
MLSKDFVSFLIRAKQNTYASGKPADQTSRPASHDMQYAEEPYLYIDTWLGGFHFIGEEAVWHKGAAVWGMNYYGKMLTEQVPDGFSHFLKTSLSNAPVDAPYRGPSVYIEDDFEYHCSWRGTLISFEGEEAISYKKQVIYRLSFHGGEIRE